MKKILTLLPIMLFAFFAMTQNAFAAGTDDFIITVKTDNLSDKSTDATKFKIRTESGSAYNYNYNVDCNGDGTDEVQGARGEYICDYGPTGAGTYTIRIKANNSNTGFPQMRGGKSTTSGDNEILKLLTIEQWGTGEWKSMASSFHDCANLTLNATDVPIFSGTTDFHGAPVMSLRSMFMDATAFTGDVSGWDTSKVTDMGFMFHGASAFNGDVSGWNTSKVTDMSFMFLRAIAFDQDISSWNVESIDPATAGPPVGMHFMFQGAKLSTLNYDKLLIGWNAQKLQSGVDFSAGNSTFCAGKAARANMIASDHWTITDGNEDCGASPVITLLGTDPETVEVNTTYTDAGATASDTEDGDITGDIKTGGSDIIDTTTVGTHTVTYNVTDSQGNKATEETRTVNVVDTTAPVITQVTPVPDPTNDPTPDYTFNTDEAGTITYGGSCSSTTTAATAGDNTITFGTLGGTYTDCTLTVTDSAGNASNILAIPSFTVDTIAPVITLTGPDPLNILRNDPYTDAGATCTDNYDPICSVTTGGSDIINTATVGVHTVTYNVTDTAGNPAAPVTRTVHVIIGDRPVITLIGSDPKTVEASTTYIDEGATAFDTEDGDKTSKIRTVNPVDTTTPSIYTVTYNVMDLSGNHADEVTRTVNVVDTIAPVITQVTPVPDPTNDPTPDYIFHTDEAGTITYGGSCSSTTTAATAGDNTITFNPLTDGTYSDCTITVTDSVGHVSNTLAVPSFTVDTVPPVITLTGPDPLNILYNDPYTEQGATCTDNLDPTCTVTIGGDTVDTTTAGTYTVNYNAVDAAGNNATQVTRTVNVTDTQVSTKPVYRFWSNKLQGHFYTISETEKEAMTTKYAQDEWRLEGIVYNAIAKDAPHATPVYRFWSDKYKHHFYTVSLAEKEKVEANDTNWRYEGIAYYAYDSAVTDSRPVYRFWSDENKNHFYTASEAEKDKVIANYPQHVWKYEAIAWYVPK